jgi:hypothetical protein
MRGLSDLSGKTLPNTYGQGRATPHPSGCSPDTFESEPYNSSPAMRIANDLMIRRSRTRKGRRTVIEPDIS